MFIPPVLHNSIWRNCKIMEDKDLIEREKTNNCKTLMGRIKCSYAKSECMLKNECSTCLFQPFRNAIQVEVLSKRNIGGIPQLNYTATYPNIGIYFACK